MRNSRSGRGDGLLVTFEGTEGSGKSTLIREVAARLSKDAFVMTREPGGSPIAEKIRGLILDEAVDPLAELFLYEAARAEHMAKTVTPALKQGKLVLCDRFTDSALAYQGYARGLPWKTVKQLNHIATGGIQPNLTVLLDIDPAVGLGRARVLTRFEAEGVEFQKKVKKGFLKAKAENPSRWMVLKVSAHTPEELASQVVAKLVSRYPRAMKQWLKK